MNTIFRRVLSSTITPSRLGQNYLRYVGTTNSFADKENSQATTDSAPKKTFTKDMLDQMVRTNKVVIFMKGNPEQPRCGFSNAVVQILRMHGVQYDAHDVLQNEELRQSIKEFTEWPTIPQIFINGDFVGGCDILLQMHQSGDLIEELKKIGIESALLNEAEDKSSEKPK